MHLKEFAEFPLPAQRHRLDASLSFLVATCFIVQTIGCMHHATEQTPSPRKSSTTDKQPSVTQRSADPSGNKAKSVEKRIPAAKEKKSPASAEVQLDTKPEQPEESNADVFAPPPPLRPPTFGGAGG